MINTASYYKNEEYVGQAIKSAMETDPSLRRCKLWVTSKVWISEVEDVEAACRRSLQRLGLHYLDLYLIHWPTFSKPLPNQEHITDPLKVQHEKINMPIHKVWEQMEALVEKGLVKNIGVSNFSVQSLWDMLSYAKIKPVVNEIEIHPYYTSNDLVKYCLANDIVPVSYCPLARAGNHVKVPNILTNPIIKELSEKYRKT